MKRLRTYQWAWGGFVLGLWAIGCSTSPDASSNKGSESDTSTVGATTGSTTGFGYDAGASSTTGTSGDGEGGPGDGDAVVDGSDPTGEGDSAGGAGGATADDGPARVAAPQGKPAPEGQLTAGIFDDNQSFSFFTKYFNAVTQRQPEGLLPIDFAEHSAAHEKFLTAQSGRSSLDLSLVIDTTGSMGDELDYLQDEFDDLSQTISKLYPNAEQRWSLVVYRDAGDEYLAQSKDFTSDLDKFRTSLAEQTFGGGGDFPEAPDAGLKEANSLSWDTDEAVAKLLFWVADAPHHSQNAKALLDEIMKAQEMDVHIYPVASSGIDDLTEFTMRQSAQLTRGRYLFLTDDSGLGGSHAEPTLPCYYVSTLRDAIVRSVKSEMSGQRVEIEPSAIVRFSGELNEEGNCYFGDGYEAAPF